MSEEEKYWGCTPVVTAHMEARMKASREYAKMVSNDDETPAQRADRARDFECGAMWEEGYSKKHGWHTASEPPKEDGKYIVISFPDMYGDTDVFYAEYRQPYGWCYEIEGHYAKINIQKWCYTPKEE